MNITVNELMGYAWIIFPICLLIALIDCCSGQFLFYLFIYIIDLDNYPTLRDKYQDREHDIFKEEREFAYMNYKSTLHSMLKNKMFRDAWNLRKVRRRWDYLTLYHMECAYLGNEFSRWWLEKEWETD